MNYVLDGCAVKRACCVQEAGFCCFESCTSLGMAVMHVLATGHSVAMETVKVDENSSRNIKPMADCSMIFIQALV